MQYYTFVTFKGNLCAVTKHLNVRYYVDNYHVRIVPALASIHIYAGKRALLFSGQLDTGQFVI